MSLLDKLKNFTQPYADDDYDEYEDDDELDGYEEEEEVRPARGTRRPNPFKLNVEEDDSFDIDTTKQVAKPQRQENDRKHYKRRAKLERTFYPFCIARRDAAPYGDSYNHKQGNGNPEPF